MIFVITSYIKSNVLSEPNTETACVIVFMCTQMVLSRSHHYLFFFSEHKQVRNGSTTTTRKLSQLQLHANAAGSPSERESAAKHAERISGDIDYTAHKTDANPDAATSASADHQLSELSDEGYAAVEWKQ